jgi:hypothetical protein
MRDARNGFAGIEVKLPRGVPRPGDPQQQTKHKTTLNISPADDVVAGM